MIEWNVKHFKAVVFDMDDTLYPERSFVFSGYWAVAQWIKQRFGADAKQTHAELQELFENNIRKNTFDVWAEEKRLDRSGLVREMVNIYREHEPMIAPFPEVSSLLDRLSQPIKVGLVSDGYLAIQKRKFSALHIDKFFDATMFSDEFGRGNWKPSTTPFHHITARLDVAPEQAIYIADNITKDFYGAKKFNLKTIHLKQPEGLYVDRDAPTPEYAPHHTVNSLQELQAFLTNYGFIC